MLRFFDRFDLRDLRAGALVALLALPLSLGIAVASGFPPASGILSAVLGGVLVAWLGSARLTIKGPAAGLIVLVLAAVADLGVRGALAAFVVAGVIQIAMGKLGAAKLMRFVPPAVVHGMLAAIGVTVLIKQLPVFFAVPGGGEGPLETLAHVASQLPSASLAVVVVGCSALLTLAVFRVTSGRSPIIRAIPAPLVAVAVASIVAMSLALPSATSTGVGLFLELPADVRGWVITPDLSVLAEPSAWYHAVVLAMVGSLESLLTVRAIDDASGVKSDLSKDLVAVGLGNVAVATIGGLPMISEVVRSSSNVEFGAKSRWSNTMHGALLFIAVAGLPHVLAHVPLAALAALLLAVAVKLASPNSFRQQLALGSDRMLVFSVTLVGALLADLLVGIALGVATEIAVRIAHGASLEALQRVDWSWPEPDRIQVRGSLLFSNVGFLVGELEHQAGFPLTIDLSQTDLVDCAAMTTLEQFSARSDELSPVTIVGLEQHRSVAEHPLATRVRRSA